MAPVSTRHLLKMKTQGEKIVAVTAYDYPFARLADASGVDIILVGDSLAMVVQGQKTTLPVTMEEMLYHTRMVSRAAERALVVGDMPFLSYQADIGEAVRNAGLFLKEAGASAVKLEGGAGVCATIKAMVDAGIPVQAHIGLTPQSVHAMGGYRIQRDEERLVEDAHRVMEAGAFSVVLEGIPAPIARRITEEIAIPTIGIGAGVHCDGQILVMHDLLGLNLGYMPKFTKLFADLKGEAVKGFKAYGDAVREGSFPGPEHSYE
ncbi:3-methyl-2-oxobutanoate hydroxymethyltransferase [Desulfobotulus alkaliphilus]|uniref:3-methyl-2-oxobutanoate hydroxymethyltransferase n=1 Tax=Desulfobotulus alkaliphilus TaxID=622671 RepID=A0A562REE6_9BACT|nr:3-methyl-2-oxobutanoate hydroxymethyltransferase [Desulfobotulus alkaliphilus]TWI66904.1 3-methyl-2-oxobutanoate hydroxymethyltransferase [Desulfobotulus alkaliphilus]